MELLIDIGNTNISIAIAKDSKIVKKFYIKTSAKTISPLVFKKYLGRYREKIKKVVIVSVCPPALTLVKKYVKNVVGSSRIFIVGKDITVPVRNLYKNPDKVGQDRLLLSFAAGKICRKPIVVVDFGTAVTFDYLNRKGEYEGGLIFPGIRIALSSLESRAALLPKIRVKPVKGFVGKDTFSSMNNGIVYGYAALCDGLIELFMKRFGPNISVIATGGDAPLIARYSRYFKKVKSDLIFDGLIGLARNAR